VSSFAEFGFGLFSPFRVFLGNHYLCTLPTTILSKGTSESATSPSENDDSVLQ